MKLGVVILHWEDDQTTEHCVNAVLIAADRASESCSSFIYVIDNGSQEPLAMKASTSHCNIDISVIRNADNLGFAKGMNVGITAALGDGADAVWLLNNDTTPQPISISALVAHHKRHPSIACLGSTIVQTGGKRVATVGGYRYQSWSSRAKPLGKGSAPHEAHQYIQPYDYVCGSAIFLTAGCLKEIRGLPDDNFLYFEELYLAEMLKSHALDSGVCASTIVIHHQGSAVARLSLEKRHYHLTISALNFTRQYHRAFLPTVIFVRFARACASAGLNFDLAPIRGFIAALGAQFSSTSIDAEKHL